MNSNLQNNMKILRGLHDGHTGLLNELTSKNLSKSEWKELITKCGRGDVDLAPWQQSSLEKALALPAGMMQRDNWNLITISQEDYELVYKILNLSHESKRALGEFVTSMTK